MFLENFSFLTSWPKLTFTLFREFSHNATSRHNSAFKTCSAIRFVWKDGHVRAGQYREYWPRLSLPDNICICGILLQSARVLKFNQLFSLSCARFGQSIDIPNDISHSLMSYSENMHNLQIYCSISVVLILSFVMLFVILYLNIWEILHIGTIHLVGSIHFIIFFTILPCFISASRLLMQQCRW